jgi:hypothetical protein
MPIITMKTKEATLLLSIVIFSISLVYASAPITGFSTSSSSSVSFNTQIDEQKIENEKYDQEQEDFLVSNNVQYDPFKCKEGQTRKCGFGEEEGILECEHINQEGIGTWSGCKVDTQPLQGEVRYDEKNWFQKILEALFG